MCTASVECELVAVTHLTLPDLLAQPGLALHHLSSSHALVTSKVAVALAYSGHRSAGGHHPLDLRLYVVRL